MAARWDHRTFPRLRDRGAALFALPTCAWKYLSNRRKVRQRAHRDQSADSYPIISQRVHNTGRRIRHLADDALFHLYRRLDLAPRLRASCIYGHRRGSRLSGIATWVLSLQGIATNPNHVIKPVLMVVAGVVAGLVALRLR